MVKITNGISTFEVTEGAFNSIYSKQGFVKVDEDKKRFEKPEVVDVENNEDETSGDEFAELLEKPIANWTKEEVTAFIEAKDINTEGAKKLSDVKELIKEYLAK